MVELAFTPNLERLVACPAGRWPGASLREVLDAAFAERPRARGYVLDDRGALRKHMVVFINGEQAVDRTGLSDPLSPGDAVFVMQALSGG